MPANPSSFLKNENPAYPGVYVSEDWRPFAALPRHTFRFSLALIQVQDLHLRIYDDMERWNDPPFSLPFDLQLQKELHGLDWRDGGSNATPTGRWKSRKGDAARGSSWSIGGATSETKGRFQGSSVASGS
jgi:hypothetical protein